MDENLTNLDENIVEAEIFTEDIGQIVESEETTEVVEIEAVEEVEIEVDEAVGWVGGDSTRHYSLYGRDEPDQHPITSITGLREELNDIEALDVVYSNERNQANYYLWEDENILQEDRVGYFVSACSDINEIKICTSDSDIFGVTVNSAGFIGAQSDVARDIKYGLVVTTGVVHVRCEQAVNVGDYVVSNNYGYAQKNENGYKVVGRHLIDGVEYAEITLVTPIGRICKLTDDINNLDVKVSNNKKNIAAAMQTAQTAYNKAGEVKNISEEAIKNALEALGKADNASKKTDDFEQRLEDTNKLAVQAKAISESAELSAERIRKEAVGTANDAVTKANNTQGELNELINDMNPLIAWEGENGSGVGGFVSQVKADRVILAKLSQWNDDEGGTQSLTGIISTVGKHEAILEGFVGYEGEMKETIAHVEQKADANDASITSLVSSVDKYSVGEFSQAYGLTREQAASILKPGYIYIPTKHKDKVSHSETFVGEEEVNEFTPGDYYVWGINDQGNADWIEHSVESVWISESIPANSEGVLKYWYIDSNEPPKGYEAYALYIWEDDQWKKVNTLAGNASNRAVSMIRQKTNEIAAEVTTARGDIVGLNAKIDENREAQVAMVASVVGEDGKVTAASIVNSVNKGGSSVVINGNHIVLNGATTNGNGTFSISKDGHMTATGGTIGGWNLTQKSNNYVLYAGGTGLSSSSYSTDPVFWSGLTGGETPWDVNKWYDNCKFFVRRNGEMVAKAGTIGGWTMSPTTLYKDRTFSGDSKKYRAYMQVGDDSSTKNTAAFGIRVFNADGTHHSYPFGVRFDGTVVAQKAEFTGGTIGGWNITQHYIDTEYDGHRMYIDSASDTGTSNWIRCYDKNNKNTTYFQVSKQGRLYAMDATINGTITATSGTIGGCTISGGKIRAGSTFTAANGANIGNWTISGDSLYAPNYKCGDGTVQTTRLHNGGIECSFTRNGSQYTFDMPWYVYSECASWYSSTYLNTNSDANIKNSISELSLDYEILFDNLKPKKYKYNDGTSDRYHTGFIAQEVEEAIGLSNLTTQDFAGLMHYKTPDQYNSMYGLRKDEFVALNTWQIQKAKTRITELENKVAELEKLIKEK